MITALISLLLLAAPPEVGMTASATRTTVGDTITLTVHARGGGQLTTPKTPGFDVVGTRRSTSIHTRQGEHVQESTLTLKLRALKRGRHRIQGADLRKDGETIATASPVRILVMRGKGPKPEPQGPADSAVTRPATPYVGQVFRLFGPKQLQHLSGIDMPAAATRVDSNAAPIRLRSGEVQLGVFTISQAGRHTVGPVQFTGGLFGSRLTMPASDIKVKPLPKRGRPAHAGDLVGPIQMTTSLRRLTGGGYTHELIATVTGLADLSAMSAPKVRMARGVEASVPTSGGASFDAVSLAGSRTFRWQLTVPKGKAPRLKLRVYYFDPAKRKWRTAAAQH